MCGSSSNTCELNRKASGDAEVCVKEQIKDHTTWVGISRASLLEEEGHIEESCAVLCCGCYTAL